MEKETKTTGSNVPREKAPRKRCDPKLAARLWGRGATIKDALVKAGYSPHQANKGLWKVKENAGLAKAFGAVSKRKLRELEALGLLLSPDQQAALVRGGLLRNAVNGEGSAKGSTRALELLGKDKTVDLFTADQSIGINIEQHIRQTCPFQWRGKYFFFDEDDKPPVLEAETQPALPEHSRGTDMIHSKLESGKVEPQKREPRKSFEEELKELENTSKVGEGK